MRYYRLLLTALMLLALSACQTPAPATPTLTLPTVAVADLVPSPPAATATQPAPPTESAGADVAVPATATAPGATATPPAPTATSAAPTTTSATATPDCAQVTPGSPTLVYPVLDPLPTRAILPGEEVVITARGGYLVSESPGCGLFYDESSRAFDFFVDDLKAGTIFCYVGYCEVTLALPQNLAPGAHKLSLEGGSSAYFNYNTPFLGFDPACPDWFFAGAPASCPNSIAFESAEAAYQPFEHGFMLWIEYPDCFIIFEHEDSEYTMMCAPYTIMPGGSVDNHVDEPVPAGLYEPRQGFGMVWRGEMSEPTFFYTLGWALAPESAFSSSFQCQGQTPRVYCYVAGPDGVVYQLNSYFGVWARILS